MRNNKFSFQKKGSALCKRGSCKESRSFNFIDTHEKTWLNLTCTGFFVNRIF